MPDGAGASWAAAGPAPPPGGATPMIRTESGVGYRFAGRVQPATLRTVVVTLAVAVAIVYLIKG